MRVLLSGVNGYIGSKLFTILREHGHEVVAFVGTVENKANWVLNLGYGVDVVVHLAAKTSLWDAESDPTGNFMANFVGTKHGIDTARRARFVMASTVTVEGMTHDTRDSKLHAEAIDCHPISVYDMVKYAAEQYVLQAGQTVFRLCNVYGASVSESRADRGIVNQFVKKGLRHEIIQVYEAVANKLRDYTFIDDVIDAFVRFVESDTFMPSVYNVCTGSGHTVAEMALMCGDAKIYPDPMNLHPIERRSWVGNYSNLNLECGWIPRVQLQEGIERTRVAFGGVARQGR